MPVNLFPPGSFGVEVGFDQNRIEENTTADFGKRQRSGFLLIPNPAQAWTAGFVEKNFEQLGRINVACRQRALFLGLRCYFTHCINCA